MRYGLQSGDQYVLYIILWCSYRGATAPRKEHRHMAKFQVQRKHSNVGLFTILVLAYIGLLILFAWQTWGLVNFLFPDDQLLMKLLTLFSFDIMAFIWGCVHMFYRFAHPTSKAAVKWGWGITNLLSLIATVLYMVIQNMFRFRILIENNLVSLGDVTIA